MAKTGNIIRKKSTKTYVFSYALIVGFWAVVQIMGHMGLLSSKMLGLLIPICAYAIMAVSLNLVVGFLGELSLGHAAFMLSGATKVEFNKVVSYVVPWLLPMFIALIIVTFVPAVSLTIPRLLGLSV